MGHYARKELRFPAMLSFASTEARWVESISTPYTEKRVLFEMAEKIGESISMFRAIDCAFRERVLAGKVYICEHHFSEEDFEFTGKLFYFH